MHILTALIGSLYMETVVDVVFVSHVFTPGAALFHNPSEQLIWTPKTHVLKNSLGFLPLVVMRVLRPKLRLSTRCRGYDTVWGEVDIAIFV